MIKQFAEHNNLRFSEPWTELEQLQLNIIFCFFSRT